MFLINVLFVLTTLLGEPLGVEVCQNQALIFNEEIGTIIDYEENTKYNIFGDIIGLSAAMLYTRNENEYSLHILRNFQGNAQLLIIPLSISEFELLIQAIELQYVKSSENPTTCMESVFPIEESDWDGNNTTKAIILHDGSEIFGTLENAVNDTLMVLSAGGLLLAIPDDKISHIAELHGEYVEGEYIRHDPNTTRLFFAPTARNIRGGSGYFADYMIFFPTGAYGITDNIAVSAGMSLIPGADKQVWFFAPKLSYKISSQLDIAVGAFLLDLPEDLNSEILGYSMTTFGDRLHSFTLGFAASLESNSDNNQIIIVGGDHQVSNRVKLITENWLFLEGDSPKVFSGGIRFFGERMAVDLAFFSVAEMWEDGTWPLIPWVDFSILLGD